MIINFKNDKYSFLSNMYETNVDYKSTIFPSAENAYQAAKAITMDDFLSFTNISPYEAKRHGNEIQMRPDFDRIKDDIMKEVVTIKFKANDKICKKLLETAPYSIVEGNKWHDKYWGYCMCNKCKKYSKRNKLGEILMNIRDEFENELGTIHTVYTVIDNKVFNRFSLEFISEPVIIYDSDTYTVLKICSKEQGYAYLKTLNYIPNIPGKMYTLDHLTTFGACEVLNLSTLQTGYFKDYLNKNRKDGVLNGR